jgi:threonine dehydrogenase-like Zn-dependent dehydrogenase
MEASLELAAKCGSVLMIGDYGSAHAGFLWNTMLWREVTFIGSNASAGAWAESVRLAVDEGLPLDTLITHRLPASEFEKGYEIMRDRSSGVVKVAMEWE